MDGYADRKSLRVFLVSLFVLAMRDDGWVGGGI